MVEQPTAELSLSPDKPSPSQRLGTKKRRRNAVMPAASSRLRRRGPKPYPVQTFQEVLRIGQGIMDKASGQSVKRVTLLKELQLTMPRGSLSQIPRDTRSPEAISGLRR